MRKWDRPASYPHFTCGSVLGKIEKKDQENYFSSWEEDPCILMSSPNAFQSRPDMEDQGCFRILPLTSFKEVLARSGKEVVVTGNAEEDHCCHHIPTFCATWPFFKTSRA